MGAGRNQAPAWPKMGQKWAKSGPQVGQKWAKWIYARLLWSVNSGPHVRPQSANLNFHPYYATLHRVVPTLALSAPTARLAPGSTGFAVVTGQPHPDAVRRKLLDRLQGLQGRS